MFRELFISQNLKMLQIDDQMFSSKGRLNICLSQREDIDIL